MCGIAAILGQDVVDEESLKKMNLLIESRGPDYSSPLVSHATTCGLELKLEASILHLRGEHMQKQPMTDASNDALLFNGQIYEYEGKPLDKGVSDTFFLFERLRSCASKSAIMNVFSNIDGPFAFIYWREDLCTLFYGRDIFGRKSLCVLLGDAKFPHVISTVAVHGLKAPLTWNEVDCSGFHCIDFSDIDQPEVKRLSWNLDAIYPRTSRCETIQSPIQVIAIEECNVDHVQSLAIPLQPLNPDTRVPEEFNDEDRRRAVDGLEDKLIKAISRRVEYNKQTCLSCRKLKPSILQECFHSQIAVAFSGGIDSTMIAMALDRIIDEGRTIDLTTVAFKDDSPDRRSIRQAFSELRRLRPGRNWRLVVCDVEKSKLESTRNELIRDLIGPCKTVIDDSLGCGCWFISGAEGRALDSSISDDRFEKIFEEFLRFDPSNNDKSYYLRGTEDNHFEFVDYAYKSQATMLFAGMGIDEQLGGYSSFIHAARTKLGSKGIFDEISYQMRRLPTRNLGRDDRVCSHHGRDVKLPYLDFGLVSYLNQLPIGLKMNLSESNGVGPKKLLRALAARWGLEETSRRIKRSLQFGTRIANLENSKEKGDDICSRLS